MKKGIYFNIAILFILSWFADLNYILSWGNLKGAMLTVYAFVGIVLGLFFLSLSLKKEDKKKYTSKWCDACGYKIPHGTKHVHIHNTEVDYCESCWQGKVKRTNILG